MAVLKHSFQHEGPANTIFIVISIVDPLRDSRLDLSASSQSAPFSLD
jgi:hypothetical protein